MHLAMRPIPCTIGQVHLLVNNKGQCALYEAVSVDVRKFLLCCGNAKIQVKHIYAFLSLI